MLLESVHGHPVDLVIFKSGGRQADRQRRLGATLLGRGVHEGVELLLGLRMVLMAGLRADELRDLESTCLGGLDHLQPLPAGGVFISAVEIDRTVRQVEDIAGDII